MQTRLPTTRSAEKGQTKIMSNSQQKFSVAVLDDYQNVALSMADWSPLKGRASITVFNDHLADVDALVSRLLPFDIVCVMRERTPMTRAVIEQLPKLRLIASTAFRNASMLVPRSRPVGRIGHSSPLANCDAGATLERGPIRHRKSHVLIVI